MATQVKRMNERMQQELDKLWESGELSDEKCRNCSQNICARLINNA